MATGSAALMQRSHGRDDPLENGMQSPGWTPKLRSRDRQPREQLFADPGGAMPCVQKEGESGLKSTPGFDDGPDRIPTTRRPGLHSWNSAERRPSWDSNPGLKLRRLLGCPSYPTRAQRSHRDADITLIAPETARTPSAPRSPGVKSPRSGRSRTLRASTHGPGST